MCSGQILLYGLLVDRLAGGGQLAGPADYITLK